MSALQEFFLSQDETIKNLMVDIANINKVDLVFKGYYIENNGRTGSFSPHPVYLNYEDYRTECEYDEITHVRYFFELKEGDETHTATIHLGAPGIYEIGFSIEELGGGVEIQNPEDDLSFQDFSLLNSYVKTKFKR